MSAVLFGLLGAIKKAYPLEKVTVKLTASTTWNKPADMVGDVVWLTGCGGGGGGGGALIHNAYAAASSGGAGAASVIMLPYPLRGKTAVPVYIGLGGAGGSNGTSGSDGGDTVFDDFVIYGGRGGIGAVDRLADEYRYSPVVAIQQNDNGAAIARPRCEQQCVFDGGYGGKSGVAGGTPFMSRYRGGGAGYRYGGGGGASMFGPGGDASRDANALNVTSGYGGGGGGTAIYANTGPFVGGNGAQGFLKITYFRRMTS